MNKIYKVIWSKTRNCYVAVAEFVKRQGKSSSGLNRRHIGAALGNKTSASLRTGKTVAAALLAAVAICAAPAGALANSGGTLQANGDYIGVAPEYNVTIDENVNGSAYGRYETDNPASGAMLSISTGGKATAAFGGRAATGDVTGNKVTMNGGEIVSGSSSGPHAGNLYGGLAEKGDVAGNEVTVSGGTLGRFTYVYGGLSEQGAAGGTAAKDGNKVTITGGTVGTVQGGYSRGDASHNSVEIAGGTVQGTAYGGQSTQGNALNNSVTVKEGTVQSDVYGGYTSLTGMKAAGNKVTISGGTVWDVYGGWVEDMNEDGDSVGGSPNPASATENTVEIRGGKVNGDVYGGRSALGPAERNTVILAKEEGKDASSINGTVYGGYSARGGSVKNNTLQVEAVGLSAPEIMNFDNYKFVLPADSKAGDTMLKLTGQGADLTIDGNKVNLSVAKDSGLNIGFGESVTLLYKSGGGGAFSVKNLTGAVQTSKLDGEPGGFDVMKYTLDKPDHEDKLNVTVSELHLYGDGGTNTPGQRQTGNTLIINSGKADVAFGGRAATGAVTGNNVKMTGGELVPVRNDISIGNFYVNTSLFGGFADDGNAEKNTVEVSGGKVGSENSLGGNVFGGCSYSGDATGNTVTISGGWVGFSVIGGYSYSGSGAATGNTVTISGGTVNRGNVYGGLSESGDATNNTVIISGGTVNSVYGGFSYGNGTNTTNNTVILSRQGSVAPPDINGTLSGGNNNDNVSNNTLQVEAVGLSAPEIRNFENYKFVLPADIKAGDRMLELHLQGDEVTIDGSRVSISTAGGSIADTGLDLGVSVTLMKITDGAPGKFKVNNLVDLEEKLDNEPGGLTKNVFALSNSSAQTQLDATLTEKYLYGEGGTNPVKGERQTGNTLNITDGVKATAAFGGRATTGDVTGNKVTMSGGELVTGSWANHYVGSLYGGLAENGDAKANEVTMSGGTVERDVAGGYSSAGNAEENTVTVSGNSNAGIVVGGHSAAGGFAKSNRVMIHNMAEGYQVAIATGGVADTGRVENNSVTVEGAAITYDIDGGIGYGEAIHNQATLAKGEARGLLGGRGNGLVSQNTATLNEGGKTTFIYGGDAGSGIATKNEVIINGGRVDNQGVMEDAVYGGNAFNGDATYNKVTLNGGAINADVYGGHVWDPTSTGKATDNTVVLDTGATGKTFNSNLYGGKTNGSGDDISGNSLQVKGKGITVTSVNNFENYRFILPTDIKAGDTMLKLTGQDTNRTINADYVNVDMAMANADLPRMALLGERITLLEKTGGTGEFTVVNLKTGTEGIYPIWLAGQEGLDQADYSLVADRTKLEMRLEGLYLYGEGGINPTLGQRKSSNTLNITDGTKATAAFGGRVNIGDVTGNKVTMSGGELVTTDVTHPNYGLSGNVYGGYAEDGAATGNRVTLEGGTLRAAYGGFTFAGTAGGEGEGLSNSVAVRGGQVAEGVYGGYALEKDAVANLVAVSGGTVSGDVVGGYTEQGHTIKNVVTVEDKGNINGNVTAGQSEKGEVRANTITAKGGLVAGSLFGGRSESGEVRDNTLMVSGGIVEGNLTAGQSGSGEVRANTLTVEGGEIKGRLTLG